MLPATTGCAPRDAEDLADERGRGRLPVRTGDGDDLALQVAERELDLAEIGIPRADARSSERNRRGHAGAEHDVRHARERRFILMAEEAHDIVMQRLRQWDARCCR